MNAAFEIIKRNGDLTSESKAYLRQSINELIEGKFYNVVIKSNSIKRNSRYKYYWSFLIKIAVAYYNKCGKYQIEDMNSGEVRLLDDVSFHEALKRKFNPVIIQFADTKIMKGGTTTTLNDDEFIKRYEHEIIEMLASDGVPLIDRDDYCQYRNDGMSCQEIVQYQLSLS